MEYAYLVFRRRKDSSNSRDNAGGHIRDDEIRAGQTTGSQIGQERAPGISGFGSGRLKRKDFFIAIGVESICEKDRGGRFSIDRAAFDVDSI